MGKTLEIKTLEILQDELSKNMSFKTREYESFAYTKNYLEMELKQIWHTLYTCEQLFLANYLMFPEIIENSGLSICVNNMQTDDHKYILQAIYDVYNAHKENEKLPSVDIVSVSDRLARTGHLEKIGGRAYINELLSIGIKKLDDFNKEGNSPFGIEDEQTVKLTGK